MSDEESCQILSIYKMQKIADTIKVLFRKYKLLDSNSHQVKACLNEISDVVVDFMGFDDMQNLDAFKTSKVDYDLGGLLNGCKKTIQELEGLHYATKFELELLLGNDYSSEPIPSSIRLLTEIQDAAQLLISRVNSRAPKKDLKYRFLASELSKIYQKYIGLSPLDKEAKEIKHDGNRGFYGLFVDLVILSLPIGHEKKYNHDECTDSKGNFDHDCRIYAGEWVMGINEEKAKN